MKKRWEFFKESDSSFGLFYPVHYVVAGFDTMAHAEQAEQALRDAGFAEDEVASAEGRFVVNHVESQDEANWLDKVRAEIARAIGTEANYIDEDMKLARRDGAFVFVHAKEHDTVHKVEDILNHHHPLYARYYQHAGVEHLIKPNQVSTL